MKPMHILGGTKPRHNERKLEADYDGGIGVFSYSGGLFLRGSVGERDVEVALDLDLLDEDSVQFFPLLFDDGPIAVSYTHLTLPTILRSCRSRWSPYH